MRGMVSEEESESLPTAQPYNKHETHGEGNPPLPNGSIDIVGTASTPVQGYADTNEAKKSSKSQDITGQFLRFLANASNETLAACAVGLGAVAYLVLGRVGLVLIGVFAGVAIHAAWEDLGGRGTSDGERNGEGRTRKEKGLDIVQRLLAVRPTTSAGQGDPALGTGKREQDAQTDHTGFAPETKTSLETFTDAIIRDYVAWWYRPILPQEQSFPSACRKTLTNFFLAISYRLSCKRPGDVFLDFLTNSSSIVIVFLSELSAALSASRGLNSQEAINEYLEENPDCSLGNVLSPGQHKRKLQAVAEDILQTFVDARTYACDPVRIFLREVLSGLVLDMTIGSCSRADFLNEWIIWALEGAETTELVEAIDAGVSSATSNTAVKDAAHYATETAVETDTSETGTEDTQAQMRAQHRRTVSKAEAAMEEAMREAQRMNEMIAEEETRRRSAQKPNLDEVLPPDNAEDVANTNQATDDDAEPPTVRTGEDLNGDEVGPQEQTEGAAGFRNFDQILSTQQPTALRTDSSPLPSPPLAQPQFTLHNARISIFDDSVPGEKGNIRHKPTTDYLFQIEPATTTFPGWMVARKYPDVETLHEVLRRISVISGVTEFTQRHPSLPGWKGNTKSGLRGQLEDYLQDALSFRRLAESEGMKRFLDKDQHLPKASTNKGSFGFPNQAFESMGKGVLDVLTIAPKGAASGGKALVGGVNSVFGGVASLGQKKQLSRNQAKTTPGPNPTSRVQFPQQDAGFNNPTNPQRASASQESIPKSEAQFLGSLQDPQPPPHQADLTEGPSATPRQSEDIVSASLSVLSGGPDDDTADTSDRLSERPSTHSPVPKQMDLRLPPPPSEISDDYRTSPQPSLDDSATLHSSISTAPTNDSPIHKSTPSLQPQNSKTSDTNSSRIASSPLTMQETTVAVELFFATINELYTLSSAWSLRLTLLNTAKSFLLRPGNANLEAIRHLLQSTIIDANISDSGIATHINKVRENALPTEEELKKWPLPLTPEESEQRREKARKLLVAKGMPQALTSVMGQAASGEALGKVFDCLQIPEVARGLVFAITLQAVRALTQ